MRPMIHHAFQFKVKRVAADERERNRCGIAAARH